MGLEHWRSSIVSPALRTLVAYSPAILDAIQGPDPTLSRHIRTEWRTWWKKLVDNNNVIGNWPGKVATNRILIRCPKISDLLADDYRAILLAILEEDKEQWLYVRKQPEGIHLANVLVLHILIYIIAQGVDWLVKRVDGERVLGSEDQLDSTVQPSSAVPPPLPPSPMTLLVCTGPLFPSLLLVLMWFISLLPGRNLVVESGGVSLGP